MEQRCRGVGTAQRAVVMPRLVSVAVVDMLVVAVEVTIMTLSPVSVDVMPGVTVGRRTSEHRDE